jgi:hypothetical protein
MRRTGLTDAGEYIALLDVLDAMPPANFSEYVEIIKDLKKEMK